MRVVLAVGLLVCICLAQTTGSIVEDAKNLVANPGLVGMIMRLYINLRVGNNYQSAYTDLDQYVKFRLYTRNNKIFSSELKLGDTELLNKSYFDPTKPTYFIVHGFINNLYTPAIQLPKNALLADHDCNVIGVDWGRIAITLSYPVAAAETKRVGAFVAEMVKFLMSVGGLDLSTTHFIGHSLGAQVSGFAGKNLKGLGLARITGLDPALPGFAEVGPEGRLDASDALYVDCIHTCSGVLGFDRPICQADFYPNGGAKQPGCPIDINGICSHLRVNYLFAESVSPSHKFEAMQCSSVPDSAGTGCVDSFVTMGKSANASYQGIYYVKTNRGSPYAMNVEE